MKKETKSKSKTKGFMLTSFSIIAIIVLLLGVVTQFLPVAECADAGVGIRECENFVDGSGVITAKLSEILMAPILGFENAVDVSIFIFILGGFLAIIAKTKSLETGISVLVRKLKGKELILIPILMFIFSIGGTTYGMLEETVGFYALLSATMVVAGMDTIVASATILLGAGVGVLGSTVNPFAVGVAIDALPSGINVNQGLIIGIGVALWIVSYIIAVLFVVNYAKKVIKDKGSTFLSLQEQKNMEEAFNKNDDLEKVELSGKQKVTLWIFAFTFLIMIIGFIPWESFGVNLFSKTGFLTGTSLGNWYFYESALWFLLSSLLIAVINGISEKDYVSSFVAGCADMMGVILIIAIARGASVLMQITHLDNYIIYNAASALKNVPAVLFTPLNYLLHIFLSVLVPSSSGIATLSTPIMGPLANQIGFSVEAVIMTMVGANGLVNLITPTCGAIMGGLAIAKVEYSTWFKWAFKVIVCIGLASMVILTLSTIVLS